MTKSLTSKQAKAAELVRDGLNAGVPLSSRLVAEAHALAYDAEGRSAATIGSRNMKNPAFVEALGISTDEGRARLSEVLWQCIDGSYPLWPKDKGLFLTALKIAANAAFSRKIEVAASDDFTGRSIEELEYFHENRRWPSDAELSHYRVKGNWPEITVN